MTTSTTPGKAYRVEVHNNGATVAIGDPADLGFQKVPALLQPLPGVVDVVIHGLPGRFMEKVHGSYQIEAPIVAQLLVDAGIVTGTPLRLITCHSAEAPLHGEPVAQRLASVWGGPVLGATGAVLVGNNQIRINLVEWAPDPVGGMQPTVIGWDQGTWITHNP